MAIGQQLVIHFQKSDLFRLSQSVDNLVKAVDVDDDLNLIEPILEDDRLTKVFEQYVLLHLERQSLKTDLKRREFKIKKLAADNDKFANEICRRIRVETQKQGFAIEFKTAEKSKSIRDNLKRSEYKAKHLKSENETLVTENEDLRRLYEVL